MANADEPQFSSLSARIAALAEQGVGKSTQKLTLTGKRSTLLSRPKMNPITPLAAPHRSVEIKKSTTQHMNVKARAPSPVERAHSNASTNLQKSTVSYQKKAPALPARKSAENSIRSRSIGPASSLAFADSELTHTRLTTVKSTINVSRTLLELEAVEPESELPIRKKLEIVHRGPLASRSSPPKLPSRTSHQNVVKDMTINKISSKPQLPSRKINKNEQIEKVNTAESNWKMPSPVANVKLETKQSDDQGNRSAKELIKVAPMKPPPINLNSKPSIQEIQAIKSSKISPVSSNVCLRCRDFSEPDKIASQYPCHSLPQTNDIIGYLADVLCEPFESKVDKARAIFTWLHHNIAYDVDAFFGNCVKYVAPQDTITSGLAVCGGYAGVFEAISLKAGLEIITVTGHGKGYGYTPMKSSDRVPPKNPSGHAWNAVRLDDGQWKLVDSCWGAGTVNGTEYTKNFAPRQFTCSNEEFGIRHFPQGDFFFRSDGFRPSWEQYMRGLGPTDQEPMQELGNVEDDYGISFTSFSPPQKYITVASCPENVRFQFSKICLHFDFEKYHSKKLPLFLLCLHGSDDPWLPFNDNGYWWWVDIPRIHLHIGQTVGCFALTTIDGHDAGGITKERYLQIKGRLAMGFSGVCIWELV